MQEIAFEQMVHTYQKLIFAVCIRITGDYFAAEDLTQETFLAAYRNRRQFDGQNAKAWLCRIASNKAIDYNREAARKTQPAEEETFSDREAPGATPEESYLDLEVRQKLRQRCGILKAPYNKVAIWYFCEDLSPEEISRKLQQNTKTIQTQIYRAREMLRKMYREERPE